MPHDDHLLALPPGFLIGCATAAHQVEGGTDNDWTDWERQPGRIRDGSSASVACDHYTRYKIDLEQLAAMGHTAHRFSIEWSRIEPDEGHFDDDALAHYGDVIRTCRELGMEPLVTLHHFTLPRWLADRGGVAAADAPDRFARYAAVVGRRFAPMVRWWITINEPMVLAALARIYGDWPPGHRSLRSAARAARGQLHMHARGAHALRMAARAHSTVAMVGVAHHVRGMHAASPRSPLDHAAALIPDWFLNRWWLRSVAAGRELPPLGRGSRVPGLRGSMDWVGVNHYCDELVAFDALRPGNFFARQHQDPSLPVSSFGWSVDPASLGRAVRSVARDTGLPVIVTEHGVADHDDELRPRVIAEGLAAVAAAAADGYDVRGYCHWSSMDNFEWAEGFGQRFGLIALRPGTLERIPKPSAAVLTRIARAGGVPADLLRDLPPLRSIPVTAASAAGGSPLTDAGVGS